MVEGTDATSDPIPRALVVPPGAGTPIPVPNAVLTLKAATAALSVFESARQGDDVGPPLHTHRGWTDLFYVLEDAFTFQLDGDLVEAPPGTLVLVPPGVAHTFRNARSDPSRMLVLTLPGGFEGYFADVNALAARVPGPAAYQDPAIAARWDMRVVGPPLRG
jgi:mannose-6-phosphate isomerase-like protein (cupin superfamily)